MGDNNKTTKLQVKQKHMEVMLKRLKYKISGD